MPGTTARILEEETNNLYLLREKATHITKAARSATVANILAPLLCIPAFGDEVATMHLGIWLSYMFAVIIVRTWIIFKLEYKAENIRDPQNDLKMASFAVGIVGFGWGLGWVLMVRDLQMVNRMIYVYMITAAMIAGMFAYSVNKPTFYAFTLPIMIPSLSTALWSMDVVPWTFSVGLATLYIVVLSIAKNFSQTFEDSVRLRFRNERLYQELANERDQSIAANVAKSKFIAVASHDLRQPMHAVNVYLDIVDTDKFPEQDKLLLGKIKNSITSLNSMFDSLLNISKLDAHVTPVNNRIFSLQELANTLRDLNESRAKSKGLDFKISCLNFNVCGDRLLLQQIVGNLISNAIQYTETGAVEVRLNTQNGFLAIEVIDTGCGVDESEQQQIFHEFYRADKTRSLHDGLGLGLSIVQRLCNLIGAEVHLHSNSNNGSKFVILTPYLASSEIESIDLTAATAKPTFMHRLLQGKYIAVIEDNPVILDAYKQTLASEGAYVYVLAESEPELDAQLETIDHIDCILSDYRLSQSTGDVLIQRIRENYNEEIPAIIVTGDTSPSHFQFFAKLNVQVLHKPVSFQEVAQVIKKLVDANRHA
jgi:signal transduction histidine kinase/CheY-like chemotaxis protein